MKTRPVLTQEDFLKISAAAEAEARKNGWMVAIAILDDGGHLLHFVRMDGATPANAGIALEKGRTAVAASAKVAIAVVDANGDLVYFRRMDGATPANAGIALEKGRTAAISRRSSGKWEEIVKGGRTAMIKMPGILPVQGGVPIVADGTCIGAVGVSGVQSHQDEQIAQAGIDALLK